MDVKIFTDGAARGNPEGPGGYGAILQYVDQKGMLHEKELSGGYVKTTNNRMELMAVIAGLEALNRPCRVEVPVYRGLPHPLWGITARITMDVVDKL